MPELRFDDGVAYEQMMGVWSRLAGDVFLDWLKPGLGLRWIDVGCGNGAFTELILSRCAPAEVQGIDPSEGQLAFARTRPGARGAHFQQGDAMALPFASDSFDAAVMALVLVFVPDPAKGIAELVRVARPGGLVATYMWDMLDGGFPLDPILAEMNAMGLSPTRPPRMEASRLDALNAFWTTAGLAQIETREIRVERTFRDFEEFWLVETKAPSIAPVMAAMPPGEIATLRQRVQARLPAGADGRLTYGARAHAIKGLA
ncbi:class I SAM-dependent methyltransferase [Bradyrhizobium cajani]|uniref:Methyltransferase domain-containing protein n=1 Tax=Bradyrhizobium cajani TaxID=1928661 RepID=A0A844TTG1_9BRAD|nr:class I SAM-dependent methyltransferase [Bradyrhizobium cajani]MCP3373054.1 methyltransferase domain-containing protein [Bradyrhizobium cajani]MVT78211.1 methyltransferase domain-containing protein [Bradyrhizobium cajani]